MVDYKNVNTFDKKFEVCRLCGETSSDYIPIFEDKDNYILEKISRCLPIFLFPNDNLPSNVCRCCLNDLNISCKLILTAIEVDEYLRMQLNQRQRSAVFTDKDVVGVVASCEEPKKISETNVRLLSLKELKMQAIVGPVKCDLCDLNFQNVNVFDNHMEQFHFLKWKCSFCDNSFYESKELMTHKTLKHGGNIIICDNCRHTFSRNKKYEIIDKNVQNNQENIDLNTQKNQIHAINVQDKDENEVQNDQNNTQEISETNVQNYQNNALLIIDEKNIQSDWKTERETIDENSYENEVVTFENDETAASINLAMDTEDNMEMENENDTKQTGNHSGSDTDEIIEKCTKFLKRFKPEQRKQLFCDICEVRFGKERYFQAHIKIHEERAVTCTICSTEHLSTYDLFLHKREEHNKYKKIQVKYACDKCGKFFTHGKHWEAHNEEKCSRMVANRCCKYCNAVFTTRLKLTRHLRSHKLEMLNDPTVTVYKCVACPKVYVDKEFYEQHRNIHDPECWDKFRCTECDRPFRNKIRLQEHQLAIHEKVRPYSCDVCERSFVRVHDLRAHSKVHFGHDCSHCDEVFKKKLDLVKHLDEAHGLTSSNKIYMKNDYICNVCHKKLSTYQALINHERIHTGEMPFSCKICHRAFRSAVSRWTHMQRHKKGTFVCEHCGKCFSYKQNLIVHVSTHLPVEDRKYQCDTCGKKFLRNSHLTIHKRTHNGIRPYECDLCSVSFTQKNDMKRHRLRHFKEEKHKERKKQELVETTSTI